MSGASFAWGAHKDDTIHAETLKESMKVEMTNIGILTALLLTITCGPLLNDPPACMEGQHNAYFAIWFVASVLLAWGVLVSIIELITIESFKEIEQLILFRKELGVFIHIPLYFLIGGGSTAVGGLCFLGYFKVSFIVFIAGAIFAVVILFLIAFVFVKFVQVTWDAFSVGIVHKGGDETK